MKFCDGPFSFEGGVFRPARARRKSRRRHGSQIGSDAAKMEGCFSKFMPGAGASICRMDDTAGVGAQQAFNHTGRVARVGRRYADVVNDFERFAFSCLAKNRFDKVAAFAARAGLAEQTRHSDDQPTARGLAD